MRKIEVPTDTPTEFKLSYTAAQGRGQREREIGECRREETKHLAEEAVAKKCARTDRSDTDLDTEGGGGVSTFQSHSRNKNGDLTNIYLTDSDEEVIVKFFRNNEELYNKTNKHYKGQGQEGMAVGEVRQQPQVVCQSVHDLFQIPKACYEKLAQS